VYLSIEISYLFLDPERLQNFSKCFRKVLARMGHGNFHQVKQERQRLPFVFKMNSNCNEGFMIRRRPSICGEAKLPFVFLMVGKPSDPLYCNED
jgi:hypothetical protein